jgi:putative DNA primase/helicase
VEYDPAAKCPLWETFLGRIMAGNERIIRFLQRAVGYSLTGLTREQLLFLLYGRGSNGKSTFLEVLRAIFGDYACQSEFATFLERRDDSIRNDVARLDGARLVTAIETERTRRLSEPLVKQLTGSDTVTARFLHQEFFEFKPTFKLWLATNHKPTIQGTDEGIWRRIRLIPFTVEIPAPERDLELGEKLLAESSGIVRWAVEGCLEWQRHGLMAPPEVIAATTEYRTESDVLATFLDECCVVAADAKVTAGELYKLYREWADRAGEKMESQRWFSQAIAERGFGKDRKGPGGKVQYLGVGKGL